MKQSYYEAAKRAVETRDLNEIVKMRTKAGRAFSDASTVKDDAGYAFQYLCRAEQALKNGTLEERLAEHNWAI